jgi:molybdopterin converting factor subunit 1
MTVKLFAAAREIAGRDSIALELPAGSSVAELRRALARCVPALTALLAKSAIAVNHDFAEDSRVLDLGDEVAVIPPVSGG